MLLSVIAAVLVLVAVLYLSVLLGYELLRLLANNVKTDGARHLPRRAREY